MVHLSTQTFLFKIKSNYHDLDNFRNLTKPWRKDSDHIWDSMICYSIVSWLYPFIITLFHQIIQKYIFYILSPLGLKEEQDTKPVSTNKLCRIITFITHMTVKHSVSRIWVIRALWDTDCNYGNHGQRTKHGHFSFTVPVVSRSPWRSEWHCLGQNLCTCHGLRLALAYEW